MADSEQRLEHMLATLRGKGHRITPQRMAVLKILAQSHDHPSVDRIYQQVKKDFPTTSLATIYKTIALLKETKEVLELGFADWGSRYDGNRPLSPSPCYLHPLAEPIVDPVFSNMDEMAAEMSRKSGFEITHHRLDFFGLCPKCRNE